MSIGNYSIFGVVGKNLNENSIKNYAKYLVKRLKGSASCKKVLIAKDNRVSGDYIISVLCGVLLKNGIDVDVLDVVTSPCLVFLMNKFRYNAGVMITAGDKSAEYNGINIYLNEKIEKVKTEISGCNFKYGKFKRVDNLTEVYLRKLKNELKCKNKYIFDCGNGATTSFIRKLFSKNKLIGDDSSGEYINDNFGTQHIQTLLNVCKKTSNVGFAFNGDGTKVLAVDENGELIDCNKLAYILSKFYLCSNDTIGIIGTSSLGLEVSLRRLGVNIVRNNNANVVIDATGEMILNKENCGDGIWIALKLISILEQTKMTLAELLKEYKNYFEKRGDVISDKPLKEYSCKDLRVVLKRVEDKVDIFVEGLNKKLVEEKFDEIVRELQL